MNEQEKTHDKTTPTEATAQANTQAVATSSTSTTEAVAPNFGPHVDPDPLLTADIEISEEEQRWRADPNGRLTRKHKPTVSMERIEELQGRRDEIMTLGKQREQALRDDDMTKANELEQTMQRRTLKPYDQVVLRMYEAYGLLTEEDRTQLREADARRAIKRAFERRNRCFGRYDASEQAGAAALVQAYQGAVGNPARTSKRAERRRALREA